MAAGDITADFNWDNTSSYYIHYFGTASKSVYFGHVFGDKVSGPETEILKDGNGIFDTFCVEIDQNLYIPSRTTYSDVDVLTSGISTLPTYTTYAVTFSATQTNQLRALWGTYMAGSTPVVNSAIEYAAFQMAVWKVCWGTGNVGFNSNTALENLATSYIAGADSNKAVSVAILRDGTAQDLITRADGLVPSGDPVPEPFTMGLGAIGFGLALLRKRNRKA
jgi:hypothetical protein